MPNLLAYPPILLIEPCLPFYQSSFSFDPLPYLSYLVPYLFTASIIRFIPDPSLFHSPLIPARAHHPHDLPYALAPSLSTFTFIPVSLPFHPLSFVLDMLHSDHTIPDV
jgi:hypothetical protein